MTQRGLIMLFLFLQDFGFDLGNDFFPSLVPGVDIDQAVADLSIGPARLARISNKLLLTISAATKNYHRRRKYLRFLAPDAGPDSGI